MNYDKSNIKYSMELPIYKHKAEIVKLLETHQVLIITGDTGCGKSTQLPKILIEYGYTKRKSIACLHPRCVSAMTLAKRVSEELNETVGELVGYRVRFYSKFNENTKVMFMTPGFMLKLITDNSESSGKKTQTCISKFSVIVIDEAHERSIQTDIMLGKMKQIMRAENKQIKLVIMSATINSDEMRDYYPGSAVVCITDVMSTVDVIYRPLKSQNYLSEIMALVIEILRLYKDGDILIFLQTEEKVRKCKNKLKELTGVEVLKFFASMDYDSKMRIFEGAGKKRRVIVATNVAETSLTIPGVDFVIDSGAVKRSQFNHMTWLEMWITRYVTIAEADQRKGRTGRIRPGVCYRMYPERFVVPQRDGDDRTADTETLNCHIKFPYFESRKGTHSKITEKNKRFLPYPEPELRMANLGSMVLMMKSMRVGDIMKFPFMVHPEKAHVDSIIAQLKNLSLLTDDGEMTKLGTQVSCLPLEPRLGKVAIIGSGLNCRKEVLIIISMLSVIHILKSSSKVKTAQREFFSWHGDLFRLLQVYLHGKRCKFDKEWCKSFGINRSCIKYAALVCEQLSNSVPLVLEDGYLMYNERNNLVKAAFLSGFFQNIAAPQLKNHVTFNGDVTQIHPSSCLGGSEEITLFQIIHTSIDGNRIFLRNCTALDPYMLQQLYPRYFKIKTLLWRAVLLNLGIIPY